MNQAELRTRIKSQLGQDWFVAEETNFKENGFFVEFGATNGVDISNTYFLQSELAWTGILAEPSRYWHESLLRNRPGVQISFDCVWKESNQIITFNEVSRESSGCHYAPELSTIDAFTACDNHARVRQHGTKYDVNTITLHDLLVKHNAPKLIDFLSIDTEGSEFDILENFDFDSYDIRIITCEHNYTPMREKIYGPARAM